MRARKAHEKSRHGCVQCKRRRVKCDERRPQCISCTKRRFHCQYTTPAPFIWSGSGDGQTPDSNPSIEGDFRAQGDANSAHQSPSLSAASSGDFAIFNRLIPTNHPATPSHALNLLDLELLLNWTTSACALETQSDEVSRIWREVVPKEALSYPFLMHSLLAVSALHMLRRKSKVEDRAPYLTAAAEHQNQALGDFRTLVGNINESNCKAVFAGSSLVVLLAFGSPNRHTAEGESGGLGKEGSDTPNCQEDDYEVTYAPVDDLRQIIVLCKGLFQVLETMWVWLCNSEMGPIVDVEKGDPSVLAGEEHDTIQHITRLIEDCDVQGLFNEEDKTAYLSATEALKDVLSELSSEHASYASIRWPLRVPARYMELLEDFKPPALVILAHYSVILHYLPQWWYDGWSARVLRAIHSLLDSEWRDAIRWPMKKIGWTPTDQ